MSDIRIFFKFQLGTFLKQHLLFVMPLYLLFYFSPYQVDYIEYFMIGAVLLFQFAIYSEKSYRHQIHDPCRDYLNKTKGKMPSKNEISVFQNKVIYLRGVSVGITIFSIVIVMLVFGRL